MSTRLVIHQPNFLPYIGFFEQIRRADIYIAFDDVQFQENEFQNRNFIKCANGKTNLTLPVKKKDRFGQLIKDVELSDDHFIDRIANKLDACYRKAPYFREVMDTLLGAIDGGVTHMIDVNLPLISTICQKSGLRVDIMRASSFGIIHEKRIDRLLKLMKAVNAELLIVGTGAGTYLDRQKFLDAGYDFEIHEFKPKIYPQLYGEFISHLSIVDYLMNVGWTPQEE